MARRFEPDRVVGDAAAVPRLLAPTWMERE